MRKSKTLGGQKNRLTTTPLNTQIRGELREWCEVHLNDTSYISGKIYGDIYGKRKDGSPFKTGFVKYRMETSEYTLIFVGGNSAYVLYRREQLLK